MHSLLDLPAEIRLRIFEYVEDGHLPRTVDIAQNCTHRVEAHGCPTLAALSRTSRAIHEEVAERLYRYRTFNVDVMGADSLMALWRRNFSSDLSFLVQMQSIHLAISINTGTSKLSLVFGTIRKVLRILTCSTELRDFTVQVREVYHLGVRHSFVNQSLQTLREQVTAQGIDEGRDFSQIELTFAWKALEFFQNGFRPAQRPDCGGIYCIHDS